MSEKGGEFSDSKSIPIIFQSKSIFNIRITLNDINYDVWFQLVEIHIAERETLSYIVGKTIAPLKSDDGYER